MLAPRAHLTLPLLALALAGFTAPSCEPGDRPDDPPPRPTCTSPDCTTERACASNADCGFGEVCSVDETAGCEPCPDGELCPMLCAIADGTCEAAPCGPNEDCAQTCASDADCPSGAFCEHYASCAAIGCPAPPPSQCVYLEDPCGGLDCGFGYHCEPGAPSTCGPDEDCDGSGVTCVPDQKNDCRSDADCGPGGVCEGMTWCVDCVPDEPDCQGGCFTETTCVYDTSRACASDADCGIDELCALSDGTDPSCPPGTLCMPPLPEGTCVPVEEDPCWGAWIDEAGTCRSPNDGLAPTECCVSTVCIMDSDCGEGSTCELGRCATPAPDPICPAVDDPRIDYIADAKTCETIDYACAKGWVGFGDACGCGCIEDTCGGLDERTCQSDWLCAPTYGSSQCDANGTCTDDVVYQGCRVAR